MPMIFTGLLRSNVPTLVAVVVATALTLSASVSAQTSTGGTPSISASKGDSAHRDVSLHSMDMKQSMDHMSQEMASAKMSGDPDRDFATMMRIHHQGAVDMAQAQLASGKDPQMRKLAKEIVAAQKKEIALIDRWLKKYEKR